MNRLALMVLRNLHRVPGLYGKLCRRVKKYKSSDAFRKIILEI